MTATVLLAATALVVLRTRVLPAWLAWASLVFAVGLFGATDPMGALGPTMQAISGIGVGVLTYRRAIRADDQEPAR